VTHRDPPGHIAEDGHLEIIQPDKIHVGRNTIPLENAQLKNFQKRKERKNGEENHRRNNEEIGGEQILKACPGHFCVCCFFNASTSAPTWAGVFSPMRMD